MANPADRDATTISALKLALQAWLDYDAEQQRLTESLFDGRRDSTQIQTLLDENESRRTHARELTRSILDELR